MTMTKARLVEKIQNELVTSKTNSEYLVETVLKLIKDALASGEDVLISRFGKFCVKKKNQRIGRNPSTDKALVLKKRKVVTFKCSGILRDQINGK
jgi:integration host factor subunit alpha